MTMDIDLVFICAQMTLLTIGFSSSTAYDWGTQLQLYCSVADDAEPVALQLNQTAYLRTLSNESLIGPALSNN